MRSYLCFIALLPASTYALRLPGRVDIPRRSFCVGASSVFSSALFLPWSTPPAHALESSAASITDKVRLEFVEQISAEESRSLPITIGLFGKDAPEAVKAFKAACAGELMVPCPTDVDTSTELMERTKQSKKAAYRACLGSESIPVTYAYSQVWSVQRGKRIDAGQVQGKFALRLAPTTPLTEGAGISHDAAGLLSVKRGGGVFDFGITTAARSEYDEDYVVIGRVLEGMDSVAALDALPVVKAADALNVEAASNSREKACAYGSANSYCAQNKPLRKVLLLRVAVV